MITLARLAAVGFAALSMFALLLGLAAAGLGRPDRTAAYLVVAVISAVIVGVLMRRDMRRRRAAEQLLPPDQRPQRRVPRSPIAFPLRETLIGFAFWYAVVIVVDRAVTGATTVFTLAAVAPFAAFMLTALTVAGRHMAFRLTAEEADSDASKEAGRG